MMDPVRPKPPRKPSKVFRAVLYARVSTIDQQTLSMQSRAMRQYAARTIAVNVREAGRSVSCWCGGWTAGARYE